MITERDLQEAIAECKGTRNPDASTCIKLAAFLTIAREMYGEKHTYSGYSYAPSPVETQSFQSDTEFGKAISEKPVEEILNVMDELMTALQVVNPRLYAGVMRKLK